MGCSAEKLANSADSEVIAEGEGHPGLVRQASEEVVGQTDGHTAVARQADGHAEVILRESAGQGKTVTKVPNGERLTILEMQGGDVRVRWRSKEGWAKAGNLQNMRQPGKSPALYCAPDENGVVAFIDSDEALNGWIRKVGENLEPMRSTLFLNSADMEFVKKTLLGNMTSIVCIVCARTPSRDISTFIREEQVDKLGWLPMIIVSRADISGTTLPHGNVVVKDTAKLKDYILALPSKHAMRSESTAGLYKGELVNLQFGPKPLQGSDWVFTENRTRLAVGMHSSHMDWYPRVERYDEHISEVAAYMQSLTPVHRCSPGTFLAILREGGLLSREELNSLTESDAIGRRTSCTDRRVLRTRRHVRLQQLARDARFVKHRRKIFKYAENVCELQSAVTDGTMSETEMKGKRDKLLPEEWSPEDKRAVDAVVAEVIGDVLASEQDTEKHGLGYGKDERIGTNRHVFATLGVNNGFLYGNVVIVLNEDLLYNPGTWLSPLAATGYLSPYFWVFKHRPWSGIALVELGAKAEETNDTSSDEKPETMYAKKIEDTPENDEKGIEACMKSSLNMAAVEGWSATAAREVDAMCHYLSFNHRVAYEFDCGKHKDAPHAGYDWREEGTRTRSQKALLDAKKTKMLPGAWEQVVKYYNTKDSHTLYECHLPPFVPLGAIDHVCIASKLYQENAGIREKVENFVLPDGRPLKSLVVKTNSQWECIQWQRQHFLDRRTKTISQMSSKTVAASAEQEKAKRRPISVYLAGRGGRPSFLPPDFGYWGQRFAQDEYDKWTRARASNLQISFACRAWHDIRVFFSSTAEPQDLEADLKDSRWSNTTYSICLGSAMNKRSYITRGILGTRHAVHKQDDPSARCTGKGQPGPEGVPVWDRYWFQFSRKGSEATIQCGRGIMGDNVMMSYVDPDPIKNIKYIGLACWNEPTVFCDLGTS